MFGTHLALNEQVRKQSVVWQSGGGSTELSWRLGGGEGWGWVGTSDLPTQPDPWRVTQDPGTYTQVQVGPSLLSL